jgi:hypothetical protein
MLYRLKLMREFVEFFHDNDKHHSSGAVSLITLHGEALTDAAIQVYPTGLPRS